MAHTARVTFPATLRVPRDAAPGTLLTSWTTANSSDNWVCSVSQNNIIVSWLDLAAQSTETLTVGNASYAVIGTGVEGIGVIAKYSVNVQDGAGNPVNDFDGAVGAKLVNNKTKMTGSMYVSNTATNPFRFNQTISLALVKTSAPLKGSTVTSATVGNTGLSISADGNPGGTNLRYQHAVTYGTVNIIQGTCQTPDVVIPLGDVSPSIFKGPGVQTSNWVDRTLVVNNCPSGLNHVKINFRTPVSGWQDQANRVFKLSNADANGTAKGIGIQMYLRDRNSIATYESPQDLTEYQAISTSGGSFTVPIGARYYKPASTQTLTSGVANGAVTFDMVYD